MLIPVLRVIFILWEMFIEVTFGFHESSHSHYMRCVSRTFGFHELSVIVDLYIQAYGLEALVAEKVFFLNCYVRKSQTSVYPFLCSPTPCWEILIPTVILIPTPTSGKAG